MQNAVIFLRFLFILDKIIYIFCYIYGFLDRFDIIVHSQNVIEITGL